METEIPKEIYPILLEIANRLWSGHGAIMIGSGFSKNAQIRSTTTKTFPNWNELGDCFYKKLHGEFPTANQRGYLNALKLADEVQATFGRTTLDQIIKTEIPDKEYQPSTLHERLLQLPWSDVFTTNYDTLLERSAEKILQRRYETVINKEDLILSTKPRIIKLHGSFPSERPFIISEEDYRRYPIKFAPFVNTVQQSLLENTLCLVGFSGDDPNFLNWIGWIRDNLGKDNSPKIYLIGILSLTLGEKKLLENRNIVPLDLSCCKNVNGDHEKALSIFLNFLHEQGKAEEGLKWPYTKKSFEIDPKKNNYQDQVKEVVISWKSERIQYPNWLIAPAKQRDILQTYTEDSYSLPLKLSDAIKPFDIELLFEFNWRIEACLCPIANDHIEKYEEIINRYNPYPDYIEEAVDDITPKNTIKLDWKYLSEIWVELQLAILRFYREEDYTEKWNYLSQKLDKIKNKLTSESIARLAYEKCLFYLFKLNIQAVRNEIKLWQEDLSLPYWEAKKAGLIAELGDLAEAEKIETVQKSVSKNMMT
jgi:hypothetical protein